VSTLVAAPFAAGASPGSEKPANVPVQTPHKYELVVGSRPPSCSALEMPTSVLALADEMIE
jgi:hypothetical protein